MLINLKVGACDCHSHGLYHPFTKWEALMPDLLLDCGGPTQLFSEELEHPWEMLMKSPRSKVEFQVLI